MRHPVRLAPKAGNELTVRGPGCLTGYAKRNYLGDVMLPTQRCASLEDERVRHERQTAAVKSPHWNK
jgi:hypothetical protein